MTKDSDGLDGFIFVDIWTDHRGDKLALEASDAALFLLHLKPIALSTGQSLILRNDYTDAYVESDGLTHHTIVRFHHIATS